MSKPCTCEATGSFIDCPSHDAATRSPAEVAADIEALRETRRLAGLAGNHHPDNGRYGAADQRWDAYTEVGT